MLSIIRVFFNFSILAYSRLEFYYKVVLSGQYYSASFEDL